MSRSLSGLQKTYFALPYAMPVLFIRLAFAAGDVRLTTAPFDISWNGFTWQGVGGELDFNALKESADDRSGNSTFTLSGVDQSILALILQQQYVGRPIDVWYGWVAPQTNLLDNSQLNVDAVGWGSNQTSTAVRDTVVTRFGFASWKVSVLNSATAGGYCRPRSGLEVPVTVGQPYQYSLYVLGGAGAQGKTVRLVPHWYSAAHTLLGSTTGPTTKLDTAQWQRLVYTDTPPATISGTAVAGTLIAVYTDTAQGTFDFNIEGAQISPDTVHEFYQPTDGGTIQAGSILATPLLMYFGFMNGGFEIGEDIKRSGSTVTISCRAQSRLAQLMLAKGWRTNLESHRGVFKHDAFFEFVPGLANRTINWGQATAGIGSIGQMIQTNGFSGMSGFSAQPGAGPSIGSMFGRG